nr:Checkpoint protein like [Ipomoea batatas]
MAEEGEKEKPESGTTEIEPSVEKDKGEIGMKPWEQHSAVISIPRFDYNAPSSILRHSHCGFLVTCPINCLAALVAVDYIPNAAAKKRKVCPGAANGEYPDSSENKDSGCKNEISESDTCVEKSHELSLVKLTRSGLLLFTFPCGKSPPIVNILFDIVHSLESKSLNMPRWCHRIFPIQGTCVLDEKELRMLVSKLVSEFMIDNQNKLGQPVKFAVGYNRRGIEETEMKKVRKNENDPLSALLDRDKCFSVVAAAIKDIVPNSVVDLKHPEVIFHPVAINFAWSLLFEVLNTSILFQVSVLIELLPLSGIPDGSAVVGVSVLPKALVSTKPRLSVKALVADIKSKGGKRSQ